jgi:hypothetical protein
MYVIMALTSEGNSTSMSTERKVRSPVDKPLNHTSSYQFQGSEEIAFAQVFFLHSS